MPELPEVETTCRGIAPHVLGQQVEHAVVRQPRLRWPVPPLEKLLAGQTVRSVERRAKYILLGFDNGTLIIHLGMSGSLRIVANDVPPRPHDHVDLRFAELCLRLHDPRRFGAMLWSEGDPLRHPRLRDLGPEPLSGQFDGAHLYRLARQRKVAIKSLLMDGKVVVGVGNIYATEALFRAGIHPERACHRVSRVRLDRLAHDVKAILSQAIKRGGTTLRDFLNESGNPGYFAQELMIYGRAGQSCKHCGTAVKTKQIGQRASAFCPKCQR